MRILILTLALLLLSSCVTTADLERFERAATASADAYRQAAKDLDAAWTDLQAVREAYKEDGNEAALAEAIARYESAVIAAEGAHHAAKVSIAEFSDAESTRDYIPTALALLLNAGLAVFGVRAYRGQARAESIGKTLTKVIDGLRESAADDVWEHEKADHINTMSADERKLLDKLVG